MCLPDVTSRRRCRGAACSSSPLFVQPTLPDECRFLLVLVRALCLTGQFLPVRRQQRGDSGRRGWCCVWGRGVRSGHGLRGDGGGGALGNGNSCSNGESRGQGNGQGLDGVCRDFIRNVCKRGKRCRFRHPEINNVPDLGVQKNEFIFCHDHQNKECLRSNCRFVHGSKDDEDYYKKTGELPPRLRGKVAARLGLSPMDLPHSRGEVQSVETF
ncbi:hypothetical protein WMY93_011703 [Mugilogobius chulae]|uniref:Zinc finger CCCH domain-containing protein 10 n=1 Tax=Mugilogobius chulae TaxID=88201 RepID=A0AAW0P2V2_9GOBI